MRNTTIYSPEVREHAFRTVVEQPHRSGWMIQNSDSDSQYVSIRYTKRLVEAGIEPSVGSKRDTYHTALAETINWLYKAELIYRQSWRGREAVEMTTSKWVRWLHHQCLLSSIRYTTAPESHGQAPSRLGALLAESERGHRDRGCGGGIALRLARGPLLGLPVKISVQ